MAVAGVVHVDFTTNSAAFVRDMGKASRAVNTNSARMNKALAKLDRGFLKVRKSLKRMAKGAFSLKSAIGVVAGGAGIGLLIKRSLDVADSIAKSADAIGISTDALQEYRFALDISGVAQETTDKGLKKFTRNMGELARSSSETQSALRDLDPTLLANLRSLDSVEDQLKLTFRALAGYTSQAKRVAVAQALLGRAAVDMTVAVKKGIEPFEALQQKARNLGLVISESLLRSAENAKDQLTILAKVIGSNLTKAILEAAPEIAKFAQQFAEAIPEIMGATRAFLEFIGVLDVARLERVKKLREEIAAIERTFANRPLGPPTVGADFERLAKRKNELAQILAQMRAASTAAPAGPAASPGRPAPAGAGGGLIPRRKDLERAAEVKRFLQEEIRLRRELDALVTRETESARARALVVVRAGETAVEAYNREIQELKDLRKALAETGQSALLTEKQFQRAADQALERLNERQKAEEAARRTTDQMTLAQQRLVDAGFGALDEAIRGNMKTWRDWARFAIIQIRALLEELGGGQQGAGGGIGGIFKLFGGIGSLFGFAHGGRPPVGRVSLVGEAGPEVFVPDRAGTIIPNSRLGGGGLDSRLGSAGPVSYTYAPTYNIDARNAKFGVEQDIIRALKKLDLSVEPRALVTVIEARRRDPALFR